MYRVDIINTGDYSFKVKSKDYEFTVDTRGKGITPPDTLLASLGTCIGVYIRKYAESAKLAVGEFAISVEAEFCQGTPVYFKDINVNVQLQGAELDERRKKAMLEFIKNCPVHNTLENNPRIEIRLL